MQILRRAVAVVLTANVLHSLGISGLEIAVGVALPAAALPAQSVVVQKSIEKQFSDNQFSSDRRLASQEQAHKLSIKLSQYSDNPTMPGEGTPDRTQSSGSR